MNLDNITLIIVEPKKPGNIGSICRACKNMNIKNIVLVNPCNYNVDDVYKLGWASEDIINNIRVVKTLDEIVSEMHILVGTTNRRRHKQVPLFTAKEIVTKISGPSIEHKVGILFGREDNGLSNEELLRCHYHSMIPTKQSYPAINVSQAAMIYAYECYQHTYTNDANTDDIYTLQLANAKEENTFYDRLYDAISSLPLTHSNGAEAFSTLLKRVFKRAELESRDIRLLVKLCDLILKK